MSRLIKNVWRQLEDEFMGFTPNACRNGVFKLMTEYIKHASNLRSMLQRGLEFYNLFTQDIQMTLAESDNDIHHIFCFCSPKHDPDGFFTEFWMVIWHRFSSWYIGESIHLNEARFTFPQPNHFEEMQLTFPCKLIFNQPDNRLVFNAKYMNKPLVKSHQDLTIFLKDSPMDLMTVPGENKSLASHIRKRLSSNLDSDVSGLNAIAAELAITPQTVNNRLKKERTSYQSIKDDVRRDIAISKLVNEKLTVEQIAEMLGFQEARSFTRAFKKWTGVLPTSYRTTREKT